MKKALSTTKLDTTIIIANKHADEDDFDQVLPIKEILPNNSCHSDDESIHY